MIPHIVVVSVFFVHSYDSFLFASNKFSTTPIYNAIVYQIFVYHISCYQHPFRRFFSASYPTVWLQRKSSLFLIVEIMTNKFLTRFTKKMPFTCIHINVSFYLLIWSDSFAHMCVSLSEGTHELNMSRYEIIVNMTLQLSLFHRYWVSSSYTRCDSVRASLITRWTPNFDPIWIVKTWQNALHEIDLKFRWNYVHRIHVNQIQVAFYLLESNRCALFCSHLEPFILCNDDL